MTVVSLADARKARDPHIAGKAFCLACNHNWDAVWPMGDHLKSEHPIDLTSK